jgi:hypothetical protein
MNDYLMLEQSINRLIDNQLSESDRAELLLAADRQPELWRRISLAFIEEQIWCAAISVQNGESKLVPHGDKSLLTMKTTSSSAQSTKPWWLALAAVALITATISVRMMTIGGDNNKNPAPLDPGRDNIAVSNEPYVLEMGDQKVPLYEQSDSMSDFLARSEGQLSPELLQYLQTAGMDVQPKTRYITGNAPDGRSFVFPVKQYSVRSRVQ